MINNSKKLTSKWASHKKQGTQLTSNQCGQHSANVMLEIGKSDNSLEQVNGGGSKHVAASSDPYAKPYGFYLH